MATALNVARYFIELARDEPEPIWLTHLHIQKLLYYAQGWSLVLRDGPLFTERIAAWKYGPVVSDLWPQFTRLGRGVIPPEQIGEPTGLTDPEKALVKAVWDELKTQSAFGLKERTHKEEPWKRARGGAGPDERTDGEITEESLRRFFAAELARHPGLIPHLDPAEVWAAEEEPDDGRLIPFDVARRRARARGNG